MRSVVRIVGVAAIVAASVSCGDVVRQGRSPAYLIINSMRAAPGNKPGTMGGNLLSDVLTNVTSPPPCTVTAPCPTVFNDIGEAVLTIALKDIGTPTAPTTGTVNNSITLNRIHIVYRRTDGRNTPGVDVPYPIDQAVTATVSFSGGIITVGFELVRHTAKMESPLVQLITSPTVISTFADVTFYGQDQVGNAVSVTGTIQVDFANFGDL